MGGELTISSHPSDDIWGGRGMYFWDNLGNAKYWSRQKPGSTKIIKCMVSYNSEDLLDLTDYEVESYFAKVLREINENKKLKKDFRNKPIGVKIDFLCKVMDFEIVRFFGEYKHTPQTDLINDTERPNKLTNKVKVIYCIKEKKDNEERNLKVSDFETL